MCGIPVLRGTRFSVLSTSTIIIGKVITQAKSNRPQCSNWCIDEQETIGGGERHDHEMETQVAGPIGSDFSLHSSRGCGLAVVGEENACPGPYASPRDDRLEQPAHGLYLTVLDVAGV